MERRAEEPWERARGAELWPLGKPPRGVWLSAKPSLSLSPSGPSSTPTPMPTPSCASRKSLTAVEYASWTQQLHSIDTLAVLSSATWPTPNTI